MWVIAKEKGKKVKELDEAPRLPPDAGYIWAIYAEIKAGCEVVTYEAVEAYQGLVGITLTPWEATLMIKADIERRKAWQK